MEFLELFENLNYFIKKTDDLKIGGLYCVGKT